jgi:hypothetical protein
VFHSNEDIGPVSPNSEQQPKQFFHSFKRQRTAFLAYVQGDIGQAERELYGSLVLNRLMFLYFLQAAGFLNGDTHYLTTRLQMMQHLYGLDTFYRHFLLPLFYQGLNTPTHFSKLADLFGCVPYVHNSLFQAHTIEHTCPELTISDEAFARIFTFFDTYQWQLHGQGAENQNVLHPAILGTIFEQYVNQQQVGAYYTKRDITRYIAQNTILPYLFDEVVRISPCIHQHNKLWCLLQEDPDRYIYDAVKCEPRLSGETLQEYDARHSHYAALRRKIAAGEIVEIDDLITSNLDICQFSVDAIRQIENLASLQQYYEQLQRLTILDPTCGAGAFLFAAMDTLAILYKACFERMQAIENADEFQALPIKVQHYSNQHFFILRSIIEYNLYGVDIMEEAAELCLLRMFLQLIAEAERAEDLTLLPQIDHHIRVGNALSDMNTPGKDGSCNIINGASEDRSFDWQHTFKEVLHNGGFAVIIGNPPYVEYTDKAFPYVLRDFVTLRCANLYPCVIERSQQLLAPRGRQGMILPLAAFATRNMIPFIESFRRWFPCSWLSFYHFRPSMLFSGDKVASIPTAIYLAKAQGPEQRFSTHLIKWSQEQRHLLFSRLSYCRITAPSDSANRHYYPKFGHPLENAIMAKVLQHQRIGTYLAKKPNQNKMFYRSAGGLYWKVFVNFAWPYKTTSNKQCAFEKEYMRDVFVALLNSSLFWWYYTVTFDTFNLKDYMIFGFRFSYPEEGAVINTLQQLCQQLMEDFQRHARHLKRGNTGSYTIYARKSKAIIDEIDRVLAHHYGFTPEELDFIINYDRKYRTGQDRTEEELLVGEAQKHAQQSSYLASVKK